MEKWYTWQEQKPRCEKILAKTDSGNLVVLEKAEYVPGGFLGGGFNRYCDVNKIYPSIYSWMEIPAEPKEAPKLETIGKFIKVKDGSWVNTDRISKLSVDKLINGKYGIYIKLHDTCSGTLPVDYDNSIEADKALEKLLNSFDN